ncbi:hypothetical protein DO97_21325 [Neosynechococcus sphagnicola sy1]|uniref:Glycosyl transferase family 1 domain-containing protein n=1 Tax=Neosynechococcus sphagnicola sy1 TaxID=1497020 RepID=A0A098TM10_9CYAN|nr:hypothetical protein DO97_21325 [Neosynechococcus sphagnicola sy1]
MLGAGEAGQQFADIPGIHLVATDYAHADLTLWVRAIAPDLGLILSIVPETFSYTLSELAILRIPTLTTNLGSFTDRIHEGINGFRVSPDPTAVVAKLRTLSQQPQLLAQVTHHLEQTPHRSVAAMVQDYFQLLALRATTPSIVQPESDRWSLLRYFQAEVQRSQAQALDNWTHWQQTQAQLQQTQTQWQQTQAQLQEIQAQLQDTQARLNHADSQYHYALAHLRHTQAQVETAREEIHAMETSKFWKLRDAWFQVKKVLGRSTPQ